jgi:uncharacterized membrane protein
MRVTVKPRLLADPSVFRLSDLHLVLGDLLIAKQNFESALDKVRLAGLENNSGYSFACSALIHYRKAFDQHRQRQRRASLTDKNVRQCAADFFALHRYLIDLSNKYVAHSENEYEQCLVTVQVAEDDNGNATFRGLGVQSTAVALLSDNDAKQSVVLVDRLINDYLRPEMARLEAEITSFCETLSAEELKALPDGFAPVSSSNPKTKRSWPHPGKY